jgi:hypothetical protein
MARHCGVEAVDDLQACPYPAVSIERFLRFGRAQHPVDHLMR